MCKVQIKMSKWVIGIAVVGALLSGCSTSPEATDDASTSANASAAEPKPTPTEAPKVYEIDNSENVVVEDLPTPPTDNNVNLKPSAPEQYIVQKGDTLWDISSKFLNQPWFWPEIWHVNPQVDNPHLIYPGDVINVFYVGGRPYLTLDSEARIASTTRLSPSVRGEPIDTNERIIPLQAIEQFLIRPQLISEDELEASPHIVGSQDNRLVYGAGDRVYVRNSDDLTAGTIYNVYRPGGEFLDPDTGEVLGYQALHLGDGELVKEGDVATLRLQRSEREILRGDRVLPLSDLDSDTSFIPQNPSVTVDGKVIYLFEAISQVGTYQIIAMNLGTQDGLGKGNIVGIAQTGRTVNDKYSQDNQPVDVKLPDEETGLAMVFRTFDRVSYAFIMDANRPVRIGDAIRNPE